MTVSTALLIMLILTIIGQILVMALANAADKDALRVALDKKNANQVGGIGCLNVLIVLAIQAGWVYVGIELHQPLIVAITVVNFLMTVVWECVKAALR